MASVDWSKNKGNELVKNLRHAARHNGKDVEYENLDINIDLWRENYSVGGDWNDWKIEVEKLKRRVIEIDKELPPKRVRQDRVTSVSYVIPLPKGLVGTDDEKAFFEMAHDVLADFCGGKQNITVGYVHEDEKHNYYDSLKKEWVESRAHMHVSSVPFVEGKGVNAKNFQTRQRMKELNDRINDKCLEMFKLPFYDWSRMAYERKKDKEVGRDMDTLKHESRKVLQDEVYKLTNQASDMRMEIIKIKERHSQVEERLFEVDRELKDKESRLWKYNRIENENRRLKRRLGVFERVFNFLKENKVLRNVLDYLTKNGKDDLKRDLTRELNQEQGLGR